MYDDFAPKLATILTEFSLPVQKGDLVIINASTAAEPLVIALYEAIVRRGGHPMPWLTMPGLQEVFYSLADDHQLDYQNPIMLDMIEKVDAAFFVMAPTNTKELSHIDPARTARAQQGTRAFRERYFQRIEDQSLRWNICAWPTPAAAQEAEMGLLDYTEFIYKACALDQDDPVGTWQALKTRQQALVDWLKDKRHAEVRGPGIELSFDFGERLWVNSWGNHNFPSGEIFTGPVEDSVNGRVAFNFPTVYGGREVSGVELTFENGVVTSASAAKGESYLLSQLDLDDGARRLGEFAIGTNNGIQRFTGNTLFDEKIGGTVHMALGRSIKESLGVNQSIVHWDMVHNMRDGGEIRIDGELFYQNGKFLIEG